MFFAYIVSLIMVIRIAEVRSDNSSAPSRKRRRQWTDDNKEAVTSSTAMVFEEELTRHIISLADQMDQEDVYNCILEKAQRWPFGVAVRAAKIAKDRQRTDVTAKQITQICRKVDPDMWKNFVITNFSRLYENNAHLSFPEEASSDEEEEIEDATRQVRTCTVSLRQILAKNVDKPVLF